MSADTIPQDSNAAKDLATAEKLRNELDYTLGMRYYQLYYAVVIWSNLATPLNLSINILSAITTARATDSGSDPSPLARVKGIAIALTVLATLNTFMRPTSQVAEYMRLYTTWRKYGAEFETIFYAEMTPKERCEAYRKLLSDINRFDAPSVVQPVTEFFASMMLRLFRGDKVRWLQITNPEFLEAKTTARCCTLCCFGCLPKKPYSTGQATDTPASRDTDSSNAKESTVGDGSRRRTPVVAASLDTAAPMGTATAAGPSTSPDGTIAAGDAV